MPTYAFVTSSITHNADIKTRITVLMLSVHGVVVDGVGVVSAVFE